MIAIDTNILVYAHREDNEFHDVAKTLIESLRAGNNAWAIPWSCLHELISVVTHPNIFKRPSTVAEVFGFIDALAASAHLQLLAESAGYLEKLRQLSTAARIKGPRIHDARIAALCLHHGVSELWSADRDFSAFTPLKIRNPLIQK